MRGGGGIKDGMSRQDRPAGGLPRVFRPRGLDIGSVSPTRARLRLPNLAVPYPAQSPRHSATAAARFRLKTVRLERLHSKLKRSQIEA